MQLPWPSSSGAGVFCRCLNIQFWCEFQAPALRSGKILKKFYEKSKAHLLLDFITKLFGFGPLGVQVLSTSFCLSIKLYTQRLKT
jgi:hypothetical protein